MTTDQFGTEKNMRRVQQRNISHNKLPLMHPPSPQGRDMLEASCETNEVQRCIIRAFLPRDKTDT